MKELRISFRRRYRRYGRTARIVARTISVHRASGRLVSWLTLATDTGRTVTWPSGKISLRCHYFLADKDGAA